MTWRAGTPALHHGDRLRVRQVIGCWLNERWRAECALSPTLSQLTGIAWLDMCNRNEHLSVGSGPEARACSWVDSSMLTVARVFPNVGARLLHRAALEWPFRLEAEPQPPSTTPRASIVFPVAGHERRSQFEIVLRSFFAQSVTDFEILVVEYSAEREYQAMCQGPIRYMHVERKPGQPFSRSRALNWGARLAAGPVLILHDADIVVPDKYVESVLDTTSGGFEGLQPMRYLFYLDQASTTTFAECGGAALPQRIASVGHNYAGGSTVVTAEAYRAVGGLDERFEEWGGEDNDFLDRLKTRRFFAGGFLPAIHLWHPADPTAKNRPEVGQFKAQQLEKPAEQRIRELQQQDIRRAGS